MTVQRMHHVGVIVHDLPAAVEFFVQLGLEVDGSGSVEGDSVDRVVGLEGVRSELAMMKTPDGNSRIELVKFHSPPYDGSEREEPSNAPGIRHITFEVDDIDATVERLRGCGGDLVGDLVNYENVYRLCYLRGPAGIIVELGERIG